MSKVPVHPLQPLSLLSSFPGSLVGAYLETTVGQRESMAISTVATSIGIFGFVLVKSKTGVVFTSSMISFSATLMYAIICGWDAQSRVFGTKSDFADGYTPRLFPVAHR